MPCAGQVALFAGFAFTGSGTALLGPILPALSARLHLTDVQSGRLFTAQFAGAFAAALAASAAVARIGMRGALLAAFTAIGVGFAASGWASSGGLAISVLLYGVGLGLAIPVITVMVAAMTPGKSASVMNLLNFGWCAGALAVPSMASAILSRWSVPVLFSALAATAALLGLAVRFTLDREPPAEAETPRHQIPGRHLALAVLTSALLFLYVGTETSLAGWTPTWAARMGASIYARAAPASCFWGGILVARLLAPAGFRHVAPSTAILTGLMLNAAALGAMVTLRSVHALIAGGAVAGLGLGVVFPTAVAMFCDETGPGAARSFNFVFACGALGGAAVPLATGWMTSQWGDLRAGLAPAAFCTVLMAGIEFLILKRLRARPET